MSMCKMVVGYTATGSVVIFCKYLIQMSVLVISQKMRGYFEWAVLLSTIKRNHLKINA